MIDITRLWNFKIQLQMNTREKQTQAARLLISDQRLIAFFRSILGVSDILAVKLINQHLDKGDGLDEIFYTGNDYGYMLSTKKISESDFVIFFGCQAGPLAGDGGEWQVTFTGEGVESVKSGLRWIS